MRSMVDEVLLTSQMDVYFAEHLQNHKEAWKCVAGCLMNQLANLPMTADTSFLFQVGLSAKVLP